MLAPFLSGFRMIVSRCGKLLFAYPRYIFLMRYRSLRRFPVPLVTTGIFRKASGGPWRSLGYPLGEVERGRVREGEGGYQLSGRPSNYTIPFGTILATISTFKNSVGKTVPKREPMGTPKEAQGRCRGGSYRFWYHFSSHLGSFLGAHGPLKNSWKCVTIITFKGLAPSRQGPFSRPFPGLLFFTLFSFLGTSLLHFWGPGLEKVTKWEPQWSPKIV